MVNMSEEKREETLFIVYWFGVVSIIFGLIMWDLSRRLLSAEIISAAFIIGGIIFLIGGYFLETKTKIY